MADITNVQMGPCSVTFNSTDLGHTEGGVTVSYEPEYVDRTVDKYGNTVVEKVLVGEKLTATVSLAESTLTNLANAIPGATDAASGSRYSVGLDAGEEMAQYAAELVLHPLANAAGVLDDDVVFHKALSSEPLEIGFNHEDDKVFEVTFEALLDEGKSAGNYLGFFGDSTA